MKKLLNSQFLSETQKTKWLRYDWYDGAIENVVLMKKTTTMITLITINWYKSDKD